MWNRVDGGVHSTMWRWTFGLRRCQRRPIFGGSMSFARCTELHGDGAELLS
jgi:hypothetical protein